MGPGVTRAPAPGAGRTGPTGSDPRPRQLARAALSRLRPGPLTAIWYVTALLFVVSPLLASGTLGSQSLNSMLPFCGIMALAALGQMLVIQQGGLDLSVPGMMTMAAVIVTQYPHSANGRLAVGILIAVGVAAAVGLINGLVVTVLGITPFVATLAMNALLLGAANQYSQQFSTRSAPSLISFCAGKTAGIPNLALIALGVVLICAALARGTVVGRRAEAVGASPAAARAAGLRVRQHQLSAYLFASVAYAVAGVLLAGFVQTPDLQLGAPYQLSSIAAVVLGGTALGGGRASIVATAVGALFLSQLNQVVLAMGAASSTQYLVQGAIIGVGMGMRGVRWKWLRARTTDRPAKDGHGDAVGHVAQPQVSRESSHA